MDTLPHFYYILTILKMIFVFFRGEVSGVLYVASRIRKRLVFFSVCAFEVYSFMESWHSALPFLHSNHVAVAVAGAYVHRPAGHQLHAAVCAAVHQGLVPVHAALGPAAQRVCRHLHSPGRYSVSFLQKELSSFFWITHIFFMFLL